MAVGLDRRRSSTEQAHGLPGETNDVVLSPSIKGNKEDMQRYLDWELKLKH
jgi:hypothetical protein